MPYEDFCLRKQHTTAALQLAFLTNDSIYSRVFAVKSYIYSLFMCSGNNRGAEEKTKKYHIVLTNSIDLCFACQQRPTCTRPCVIGVDVL